METLVFSFQLNKFENSLFTYPKGRNVCDYLLLQNKYCETYFCDFGSKSQKIYPQNTVLDESTVKISSAKYGLKANRKNKFPIFSKIFYIF